MTNGAHATGAPRSLLALLRRRPPGVGVDLASIGEGPLLDDFRSVAESVTVIPAPRTRGAKPARLAEEWRTWLRLREWGDRHRSARLLVNTVDYEAALWLARRRHEDAVIVIRETTAYLDGPRGRLRRRLLARGGVRLAGVGEAQVQAWREALGRPVEHLVNVYEAVAAPPRAAPARPVRFLFVGGRSPTKGLDLVLDAFERARLEGVAVLEVASGDFRPSEEGNVRRLGYVPDLGERIGDLADFLVGGSRQETFSRTVVEAALVGVPTVAWATGGYVEQVTQVGGWLVEPFDLDAMASTLRTLASIADDEYARISRVARAGATRRFDPADAAARWWSWILA